MEHSGFCVYTWVLAPKYIIVFVQVLKNLKCDTFLVPSIAGILDLYSLGLSSQSLLTLSYCMAP